MFYFNEELVGAWNWGRRWVISRPESFEENMAARCCPEGVEVPVALSFILLMMEDMTRGWVGFYSKTKLMTQRRSDSVERVKYR